VADACNSSASGGRDQEALSSKPARANSSWDPISKKPYTYTPPPHTQKHPEEAYRLL
jgi:hypothetical protein